jgi:thiol-disulfide isomerase/thioredoxin
LSTRWFFAGVGLLAALAGISLWLANEPSGPRAGTPQLAPAALYAATFRDAQGMGHPLGLYQGKILVLNFWATWCAPCRDEMPAFSRLQARWAARNVQFVGLAEDEPERVEHFRREIAVSYPLYTGPAEVGDLARRLGDGDGLLPFTVVFDEQGRVVEQRLGPFAEGDLDALLARIVH